MEIEKKIILSSNEAYKVGPSGVQITNYKTGIFSISVLSGTEQGEQDKICVNFVFFTLFCTWQNRNRKNSCFVICNLYSTGADLRYGLIQHNYAAKPTAVTVGSLCTAYCGFTFNWQQIPPSQRVVKNTALHQGPFAWSAVPFLSDGNVQTRTQGCNSCFVLRTNHLSTQQWDGYSTPNTTLHRLLSHKFWHPKLLRRRRITIVGLGSCGWNLRSMRNW